MGNADLIGKKWNIIKHWKCIFIYKNGKEILTFANIEIEKNWFYHHKTPLFCGDLDIEKVLVSNKIFFGEKTIRSLLVTYWLYW